MPSSAAARLVPGLCRLALEAGCMEVVRRRRLTRGEPHGEVERSLGEAGPLARLAALAVFDDAERTEDVPARLERDLGPEGVETFRQCAATGDELPTIAAVDLVRRAGKLAAWIQGLR